VATPNAIVVIGTSAGGVAALSDLLAGFEAHWDVSVFITIHTGRTSTMQDILTWHSTLPVWRAEHQKRFARGVYVAPPDRHLLIDENTISLSAGPKENYVRPAIDPMFRSAAEHHRGRVIGVLLTGNLFDGVDGLHQIHLNGGRTIVQHPADADVPEIPLNALRRFTPDHVLQLSQIPAAISQRLAELQMLSEMGSAT